MFYITGELIAFSFSMVILPIIPEPQAFVCSHSTTTLPTIESSRTARDCNLSELAWLLYIDSTYQYSYCCIIYLCRYLDTECMF